MGQFLGENIPYLNLDSTTQVSLPATYLGQPTRLQIMGQGYKLNSALVLSTATVGLGGLDAGSLAANTLYYVYAVVSSNVVGLVASVNAPSVGPTGFTQWRQIGRMRTFSGSAALAVVVNNFAGNGGPAEAQEVTDWTSYTPTVSTGTWTNMRGYWRRSGSSIELNIYAGPLTANGSGLYTWTLPSSFTADLTSLGASGITPSIVDTDQGVYTMIYVGEGSINAQGNVWYMDGTAPWDLRVYLASSTTVALVGSGSAANRANGIGSADGLSALTTAGFQIRARIPIAEFVNLFS